MNIYDRIRMLRKEEKLTQEELASKVGYTDRTMIFLLVSCGISCGIMLRIAVKSYEMS